MTTEVRARIRRTSDRIFALAIEFVLDEHQIARHAHLSIGVRRQNRLLHLRSVIQVSAQPRLEVGFRNLSVLAVSINRQAATLPPLKI